MLKINEFDENYFKRCNNSIVEILIHKERFDYIKNVFSKNFIHFIFVFNENDILFTLLNKFF